MTNADDITPIDRPLLRSDINEVRDIVRSTREQQGAFHDEVKLLSGRVTTIERRLWLPALVSVAAAALAILARLAP